MQKRDRVKEREGEFEREKEEDKEEEDGMRKTTYQIMVLIYQMVTHYMLRTHKGKWVKIPDL